MLAAALGRIGLGVVAHDPVAMEPARAALAGVSFAGSPEEAVASAAAVVVMVPWPEYKNFFASWSGASAQISLSTAGGCSLVHPAVLELGWCS